MENGLRAQPPRQPRRLCVSEACPAAGRPGPRSRGPLRLRASPADAHSLANTCHPVRRRGRAQGPAQSTTLEPGPRPHPEKWHKEAASLVGLPLTAQLALPSQGDEEATPRNTSDLRAQGRPETGLRSGGTWAVCTPALSALPSRLEAGDTAQTGHAGLGAEDFSLSPHISLRPTPTTGQRRPALARDF